MFKESSDINSDSFILIDNLCNYNLDLIRKTIIDFTTESNVTVQVNIHSHKIMYFKLSAEKLKDFFCSFLQSKLKFLSDVLNGADNNINRFKGKIQVANNSLTQSWNEKFREINDIRFKLLSEKLFLESNLPVLNDLINTHRKNIFDTDLQSLGIQRQNAINEKIISELKSCLTQFTYESRDIVHEVSSLKDVEILNSLLLDSKIISKNKLIEGIDFFPPPSLLRDSLLEVRCFDDSLVEYHSDLSKNLDGFQKMLLNQTPLREFKGVIDDAVNALGKDFDNYFEAIAVYRTGIFSLGAKDAISKLGLGSQMDDLEANELTEARKLSIKQKSQECLFPKNKEILNNSFKALDNLMPKISELQLKVKKLSSRKSLLIADMSTSEIDKDNAVDCTKQNLFKNFDRALQEIQELLNSKISNLVVKLSEEWRLNVEELKTDRSSRIRTFIIVTCIVSTSLYIVYLYWSKVDLPSNVANVIISGILINVVSNPIGVVFGKVTDNFPKNIKLREKEIVSRFRVEYSNIINESTSNLKSFITLDAKIVTDLWSRILVNTPRKNWRSQREDFHKDLGLCLSEYNRLCVEYSEIVKKSAEISSEYFADTQENLRKLDSFAAELQSESIQPSFSLLGSTKLNLESIIQKIRAIEFT